MKKRFLAMLLVLALTLGVMGMTVSAATGDFEIVKIVTAVDGSETETSQGYKATLREALKEMKTQNDTRPEDADWEIKVVCHRDVAFDELQDCLDPSDVAWDPDKAYTSDNSRIEGSLKIDFDGHKLLASDVATDILRIAGSYVGLYNATIECGIFTVANCLEIWHTTVNGEITIMTGTLDIGGGYDEATQTLYPSTINGGITVQAEDTVSDANKVTVKTGVDATITDSIMLRGAGENIELNINDTDLGTIYDNTDDATGVTDPANTKATIRINRVTIDGWRGEVQYFFNYLDSLKDTDTEYCSITFRKGNGSGFEYKGNTIRIGNNGVFRVDHIAFDTEDNVYYEGEGGTYAETQVTARVWPGGDETENRCSYIDKDNVYHSIPLQANIEEDGTVTNFCVLAGHYVFDSLEEALEYAAEELEEGCEIKLYLAQTYVVTDEMLELLEANSITLTTAGVEQDSTLFGFVDEDGGDLILNEDGTLEPDDTVDMDTVIGVGSALLDDIDFVDVSARDYFYKAVAWAVKNDITTGTSRRYFSPDDACTRAQAVTFLWRAAGEPRANGTNPFSDVSVSDYYYEAVLWAVSEGIVKGTSDTTFSPNATCTRAQIVTMLYRAAGEPVGYVNAGFTDVASGAYYAEAVAWAVVEGITDGTGEKTFSPDATCTRAQIVTFLYRS